MVLFPLSRSAIVGAATGAVNVSDGTDPKACFALREFLQRALGSVRIEEHIAAARLGVG